MQPETITAESHPSFADLHYRLRRDELAALADHREPARIDYTADEHATWRAVRARIDPLHRRHACAAVLAAQRRVPLGVAAIPQLADVSAALGRTSGFQLAPVAGLVAARPFFGALARGVFLATQYVRHPSSPLYTPEPDVIHELVGHVALLADPRIAALAREFGRVAATADDARLRRIERVFWFALEFGCCREGHEVRALGAGLLSSVGELERAMTRARWRAWDVDAMAETAYGTTGYQDELFVAPDFDALVADVAAWLRG